MELILIVGGLLLLDILAMRFGIDSRILDVRDPPALAPYHANWEPPAPDRRQAHQPLRIRLANGLRALAVRIDPAASRPNSPALCVE